VYRIDKTVAVAHFRVCSGYVKHQTPIEAREGYTVLPVASKAQVEEWLRLIGCTPTETADPQSTWHVSFDYPARSPHRMDVANPATVPSAAVIVTGIELAPQHLQNFANLDDEAKESFLWSLRQKVNCPEVEFQFFNVTQRLDCPSKIQFSVVRFADGLTMDSFARSLAAVFKTELGAIWLVEEHLGGGEVGPGRRFDFKKLGY
jgi:hypothetical protein